MDIDIWINLLSGLLTIGISFAAYSVHEKYFPAKKELSKSGTYSDRLFKLTSNLNKSIREVDEILFELVSVTKDRQKSLSKLEDELSQLEMREHEAKKRIEDLQNIPIAAVDHLVQLTSAGEKRSARRDYLLFAAGVVMSTAIAIILKIVGWT